MFGLVLGAGLGLGGAALNYGLDQYSARKQREFNAREARLNREFQSAEADKNRSFQADQAATQYQRAAKDLEAAGLNRILAIGSPAAAPSGSMPSSSAASISQPRISADLMKGLAAASAVQQVKQSQAQIKLTDAQANLVGEQARVTAAEASKQEVHKMMYDKFGPQLEQIVDHLIKKFGIQSGQDTKNLVERGIEHGKDLFQYTPAGALKKAVDFITDQFTSPPESSAQERKQKSDRKRSASGRPTHRNRR
jgi:hypothetical protein